VAAVEEQCRDVDRGRDVAHVDVQERLGELGQHPGAHGRAFQPSVERACVRVVRATRGRDLDPCALAPVGQHELEAGLAEIVRRRAEGVALGGRRARHPAPANERLRAVRVGRREEDAHRDSFGRPQQGGPLGAGGIHDGPNVVHALLERRRLRHRIRQPGPAPVEGDHSRELREALEHARPRLRLPYELDVVDEASDDDQVEVALAEHLVGDVDVAASGVLRLRSSWP
jgi:hypothetical protein